MSKRLKKVRKLYTLDADIAQFISELAFEKKTTASALINQCFIGLKRQKEQRERGLANES